MNVWVTDKMVATGLRMTRMLCGLIALAGCGLGLEDTSNRYEQLNIDTKALNEVLRQISDESSANANLAALEEAAGKVRETQALIRESEEARAEKKKGGGMGMITNARQASQFQYAGDAARRTIDRIREADAKAGVIVDKAVEGIEFPDPPAEVAL